MFAEDVHRAGAGLCYEPAVQKVAHEGPERVRQLLLDESIKKIFANVPFQRSETGELSLTLGKSGILFVDEYDAIVLDFGTHALLRRGFPFCSTYFV